MYTFCSQSISKCGFLEPNLTKINPLSKGNNIDKEATHDLAVTEYYLVDSHAAY